MPDPNVILRPNMTAPIIGPVNVGVYALSFPDETTQRAGWFEPYAAVIVRQWGAFYEAIGPHQPLLIPPITFTTGIGTAVTPLDESRPAKIPVSGHRAVLITADGEVNYASNQNPAHRWIAIGISLNGAGELGLVTVRHYGVIEEPSWAWTPDQPIFLGADGSLTQQLPASGFILVMGVALSPTRMLVRPQHPIIQ